MFTGCVKCCTFLFIDVIVVWFVLLFVLCFYYCFQMFKCIKKGYYVLEFFIGVGNRDIMTKELSQICLFFVMSFLNIFSTWNGLSYVNPTLFLNKECFVQGCFIQGYFNHYYSKLDNVKGRKI
jgi:hypothetical protein